MLYVNLKSGEEKSWHIGEAFAGFLIEDVVSIQADSDELNRILREFKNLTQTTQRVQSWYGDTAKSIAFFLRNY
jgi:hypothetical protein